MLGRKQELNLQFQQICDGAFLVFLFWVAHVLRYYGKGLFPFDREIPPFNEFRWVLFVLMPFGPIILELQGFYTAQLQRSVHRSLLIVIRSGALLFLLIAACAFFFKLEIPSRAVLLIFATLAVPGLLARERLSLWWAVRRGASERLAENVLLAGLPDDIADLRASLGPEELLHIRIVSEHDIESEPVSSLVQSLHRHAINRVIFAGGHSHMNRLQEAIAACETEGVEAWLQADFIKTSIARPDFDFLGRRPMIVFRTTPAVSWALMLKSVMDFIGASVLLVLASPLFLLAVIGIKLTSPGPAIFRQVRAGRYGRPFTMYKFRSMHTDAEMRKAELEAFNEMEGPVFKVTNDPRVTSFGRWLRKTSVDELPQLINVLRGDMSLVGPRPLPLYEVEKFEDTAQRRRLSVKPGLTCLWQVSGRNEVSSFAEWVRLDLEYIDNWSLWLDVKILLKTIPTVLLGLGAK